VCVCVCMYVCVCVYVCACMCFVCESAYVLYALPLAPLLVFLILAALPCVRVCMYVCLCVYVCMLCVYVCSRVGACVCLLSLFLSLSLSLSTCVCMCPWMHQCVKTCVCENNKAISMCVKTS